MLAWSWKFQLRLGVQSTAGPAALSPLWPLWPLAGAIRWLTPLSFLPLLSVCVQKIPADEKTENKLFTPWGPFPTSSPKGIWPNQYLPQYENDQGQQQQASYDATDQNPQRDGNRSALQHFQHRLPGRRELFQPEPPRTNLNTAAMAAVFPPPSRLSLLPGWWGWSRELWDGRHQ